MNIVREDPAVVVVSYNTCALLRRCLESIRAQHAAGSVVVVDNASADGSVEMVRREFPAVDVIANADNRGFAAATNQGLRAVGDAAPFVLLLNPDAALEPGALATLVAWMEAHPRVGVCAPRLVYPDGRPQAAAFRFPTLLTAWFDLFPPRGPLLGRLSESYWNGRYPEERGDCPFPIDHPLGAAMLIRRAALDQVGMFDEGYWLYAEEVDWCFRCRAAGWAIWQVPQARVVHVAGASSAQFRGRSLVALHRSRARFVRKWRSRRHQRWYRRIVRTGMLWATLRDWRLWSWRHLTRDELRARLLAYGQVWRIIGEEGNS